MDSIDEEPAEIAISATESTLLLPLPLTSNPIPQIRNKSANDSTTESSSSRSKTLVYLRNCFRYQIPMIPVIAIAIFLTTRMGGWPNSALSAIELLPSNNAKIEALKELFGSSLTGLKHAAVAADDGVCSRVGTNILKKGGNAVDAGLATVLCLGVASPASSGLGGGAFLLVRTRKSEFDERQKQTLEIPGFIDARTQTDYGDEEFVTEVIDCRETAPERADRDMYDHLPDSASRIGGLAIAVPGELRGLELAHARHGRLPWRDVVEPAMMLAQDGVPIDRHMAKFIHLFFKIFLPTRLGEGNPAARGISNYLKAWSDEHLVEGDLLRNPPLAKTLEAVSRDGADAFYKGSIAENLVKDVERAGGILTVNDMHSYKAVLRTPVSAKVSGYTVLGVPPPSSGGAVVIGALRFLSGYSTMFANEHKGLSYHRVVEGLRHAFAIRMSLSDPAFQSNVTKDAVNDLTAGEYMESLRKISRDDSVLPLSKYGGPKWAQLHDIDGASEAKDAHEGDRRRLSSDKINSNQARRKLLRPLGYLEDNGTSHMSVVDSDGNAVAITSSINGIFGSFVYSETAGVLLGNTMDDFGAPVGGPDAFGIVPSEANFIVPGKRPLSSMSPTIVLRNRDGKDSSSKWGDLVLVWGGSGGPKIISSVLQVCVNILFRKMSLFDAVTSPRIHDQLVYHGSVVTTTEHMKLDGDNGPTIEVAANIKHGLKERHHQLLDIDYTGCVQAIYVDHESETLTAVSDMRKDGSPSGY